ncbi:hypothetical protein [Pseudomonas syringae]|uniref:hypothetical protein n=1 Tax=Pseudomonas syringae TaxID=317 RepID=UPI001F0AD473|nr:hypothetical protein [Pseudomonas syringae]
MHLEAGLAIVGNTNNSRIFENTGVVLGSLLRLIIEPQAGTDHLFMAMTILQRSVTPNATYFINRFTMPGFDITAINGGTLDPSASINMEQAVSGLKQPTS